MEEAKAGKSKPYDLVYLASCPLISKDMGKVYTVTPLDLRAEQKALQKIVQESRKRLRFKRDFATVQRLSTNLMLGCRVIHYTGHGLPNGLAFEDEYGIMHIVPTETLRDLISAGAKENQVKLVFVAACHSEPAGRAFVEAGVKHVIAVKITEKVADKGARRFMSHFYLALSMGRTVKDAFKIASVNVMAADNLPTGGDEAKKYLLLPKDADHDVQIFPGLQEGSMDDCTAALAMENLPASVDQFLGRNYDVQRIIEIFLKQRKRLVTIVGERGIGKTAVAIEVGKYLLHRGQFKDGVFYFSFEDEDRWDKEDVAISIAEGMKLNIPTNRVKNQLKSYLRGKEILLILDGLDSMAAVRGKKNSSPIVSLITELLRDCAPLKILATCCKVVGVTKGLEEREFPLKTMQDDQICTLFAKLTGEAFTPDKVGMVGDPILYSSREVLDELAKHDIITKIIRGHPGRCWEAARMYKKLNTLDAVVKQMSPEQKKLPRGYTPIEPDDFPQYDKFWENLKLEIHDAEALRFWEVFKPRLKVPWEDFKARLAQHFHAYTKTRRPLDQEDILAICQFIQRIAKRSGERYDHKEVSARAFGIWWKRWYIPFTSTVKQIRNVWDRKLVMGVAYSKQSIESEIINDPVGSFMLRLSGNNPGCVVMGFVGTDQPKRVLHVLIETGPGPNGEFKVNFNDGKYQTYNSIEELILQCKRVTILHPGFVKDSVFGSGMQHNSMHRQAEEEDDGPS